MKTLRRLLIIALILIGLSGGGFVGKHYFSKYYTSPPMHYFIEVTFPQMEKNNGTH